MQTDETRIQFHLCDLTYTKGFPEERGTDCCHLSEQAIKSFENFLAFYNLYILIVVLKF